MTDALSAKHNGEPLSSENSELKEVEFLDEMEELIVWNLSFGVSMRETLREIKRLDLMDFFSYLRV